MDNEKRTNKIKNLIQMKENNIKKIKKLEFINFEIDQQIQQLQTKEIVIPPSPTDEERAEQSRRDKAQFQARLKTGMLSGFSKS